MDPITLIAAIVIIGFIAWLVSIIPMDPTIRKIVVGLIIFFVVIYLLQMLGVLPEFIHFRKVQIR